ncbi:MAG: hydrogen gas-evolving membrane-bound hydrogenase subunit E, partial [Pseudomonadota bacterium]
FRPFWRAAPGPLPKTPAEAPWQMLAGPVVLAALGAAFGIYPTLLQVPLIDPTVSALLGSPEEAKELKLWAGINVPLVLSILTFILGLLLYARHRSLRALLIRADEATPGMDRGWDGFLEGLKALAGWQTRILQSGVLRAYLLTVFVTILVALGGTVLVKGVFDVPFNVTEADWLDLSLVGLILLGTGLTVATDSRIAAVAGLGVVGIGVALIFIVFSAPDVAITQLLVETLVVVLVAVAMLRLPFLGKMGVFDWRPGDALLSVAIGAVVSVILLAVLATPLDRRLTDYFEAASWPDAFGRNIVNVILVDFRALDTFGEIAVVVIAALAAYALLRTTAPDEPGRKDQ